MLNETIVRLMASGASAGDIETRNPMLITSESHKSIFEDMMSDLAMTPECVILEPMGRNTAAVGAIASHYARNQDEDALVLLLPADHDVADAEGFWRAVGDGVPAALDGQIVTLGIEAATPETGYGYIRRAGERGPNVYDVDAFVEKPDLATAKSYVDAGTYFWNAGIFLFKASAMLNEFAQHADDIRAVSIDALEKAKKDGAYIHLDADIFATCRDDSIDYAIMEKTDRATVVGPVSVGWNDIGSWSAVRDVINGGNGETVTRGDVAALDCTNSLVRSDGPYVAAIGLENMIVVATEKAVLVTPADRVQDVKKIINQLKEEGRTELL